MKKPEVIKYMNTMRNMGYHTHFLLLNIFSDDDDISEDMVSLMCYPPKPPRQYYLMGGETTLKELDKRVSEYMISIKNQHNEKRTDRSQGKNPQSRMV